MWCGPETQETQWIVGMVKDVLYNITPELCSFQYIHCDVQRVVNGDQAELGSHPWAGYSKKFNFLPCKKKSSTFSVTRARIWGLFLRRVDNFQQVWVFNVLTKVLLGSVDYEQKPFHHKRLYYPNTSQHRYIVTAAHCVTKGQRVWVHIGDHDKTTSSETNSIRY